MDEPAAAEGAVRRDLWRADRLGDRGAAQRVADAMTMIRFTILGQPCSKANSRQIVTINDRPQVIKSKEARAYEHDAVRQIPPAARVRLDGPVCVTLRLFYASERPDLDESIVLDVLQDRWKHPPRGVNAASEIKADGRILVQRGVYRNDRQVREKHVFHGIDKANPRAEIEVEPLQAQQVGLELKPTVAVAGVAAFFDELERDFAKGTA